MIMSLPSAPLASSKTAHQREMDRLRSGYDIDWAPRAGCQPKNLAMACEKCVYGSGKHRSDCTVGMISIRVKVRTSYVTETQ